MIKDDLITIRSFVESDKNFVMATFLRGLYYGETWFSEIKKGLFMKHYQRTIENLLDNPHTLVLVACLKEDPEVILGYSVMNPEINTLHWVFVKKSWRKIGIAKSLVPETVTQVTHITKLGLSIAKAKNLDFNPFSLG